VREAHIMLDYPFSVALTSAYACATVCDRFQIQLTLTGTAFATVCDRFQIQLMLAGS
jgi:hypothetical protein